MKKLILAGFIAFSVQIVSAQTGQGELSAQLDRALETRQKSIDAFAQGQAEEGQRLAAESQAQLREARTAYESINAGESSDVAVLTGYARLLNEMEDYDLAERALLRAAALSPDDATIWLSLGQTQAALGPASESRAIRSLRNATDIEPASQSTVEAYSSLGALYQQAGLYEFARDAFEAALELDPDHTGARLTIASLDARQGKMIEAEEAFAAVEAAAPEHGAYINRILGPALAEFSESRRWLPDTAESHFAYAKLLVRAGRIEDSIWPLLRSQRLDDQNFAVLNLMGSVYRGLNRLRGAREAFMKSLELSADQPRTREALEELDEIERQNPGSTTFPSEGATENPAPGAPAETPAEPSSEDAVDKAADSATVVP